MYQTLKKLLSCPPALSGDESGIAAYLADAMRPFCDEVRVDALGNLICLKKGSAKSPRRVMLSAHMDEVGFLVSFVEENGYLRVTPVGGVSCTAAAYSEVVFSNGVRGVLVPAADAPEKELPKTSDLVVDIGANDRRAANARVSIGDALALSPYLRRLSGKRVIGRPLDDRIGCAVLLRLAELLQEPVDDIFYVFTVQEEVGCRGAGPAAFDIAPQLCLNVDVTATGDEQGAKPMAVSLGRGVAVKIKDASVISDRTLVKELLDIAHAKGIPVQSEILPFGGTDTSAVQMSRSGCRASALSIPCRYIHTGVETADLGDAKAAVSLLLAFLGGKA